MPLKLDASNINALVDNIYRVPGKSPAATSLTVSEPARRVLGSDQFVSSTNLKQLMRNPNANVAFAINDPQHPEFSRRMAEEIAADLDKGDGRDDGHISINSKTLFDHVLPGGKIDLPRSHITSELSSGFVVIGPDGQLMPAFWAKSHGKTIVSLRQGEQGPEISMPN